MKKFTILAALLVMSITLAQAQKYGHLNFGNLISRMPETTAADAELKTYQEQLVAKGEEMAANFQAEATKFVQAAQAGNLSPQQQQTQQQALEAKQKEIAAYEQEVIQKVQTKRAELLGPIVQKAEEAVQAIAKENGYVMVFDTSEFNAILFAKDADDLYQLVAARLGIKTE